MENQEKEQTQPELELSSVEAQLVCLYADREKLESELGTADAGPILEHIRALEAKLRDAEHSAREFTPSSGSSRTPELAALAAERDSFFESLGVKSFDELGALIAKLRRAGEPKAPAALPQQVSAVAPSAPVTKVDSEQVGRDLRNLTRELTGCFRSLEMRFEGELPSGRFFLRAGND
jgi:hypothetical protein